MSGLDDFLRPAWPVTGDERFVTTTLLDFHRCTLAMKCRSLSDEQLRQRSVETSTLTLLGLVRHMTEVERYWLDEIFLGLAPEPFYDNSDDPDADFHDLDSDPVELVIERWVQRRTASSNVVDAHDFDERSRGRVDWIDEQVNLRFIVVHLVEEYARHCGHADLLREALDGATGH